MKSSPQPRQEPTVQESIDQLGPWFHNLHLPDGTQTAPNHFLGDYPWFKWQELAPAIPQDLSGWTVLDIGCNAGFYSFQLAGRGACVTGVDRDLRYLTQARWAAGQFHMEDRVQFRQMQVYDLAHTEERFDLVLFMDVFHHLRYPMLGLDIAAQKTCRLMVFQALMMPGQEVYESTFDHGIHDRGPLNDPGWPKMSFIEHRFAGDPSNWWIANRAGAEAMLRSAGLRVISQPSHEMLLCEPDPANHSCMTSWNLPEFLSATGQPWNADPQAS